MNHSQSYVSEAQHHAARNAHWRRLPRLLISRKWRWFTLGVIGIALVMLWLGLWQLDRRAERRANNALIEQRTMMEPIQLTGQELDPLANEYRRATVTGVFDNAHSVLLRNRSLNGVPGMHLLTPLRIEGSDQAVLINRGWIPLEVATEAERPLFDVAGTVEVEGYVRAPRSVVSSFAPQDRPPENGRLDVWFWPDVPRISEQVPYPLVSFYVEAERTAGQTAELPRPQPQLDLSEGPHLGYAIQWFSFMIILIVGYGALVLTRTAATEQQHTTSTPNADQS